MECAPFHRPRYRCIVHAKNTVVISLKNSLGQILTLNRPFFFRQPADPILDDKQIITSPFSNRAEAFDECWRIQSGSQSTKNLSYRETTCISKQRDDHTWESYHSADLCVQPAYCQNRATEYLPKSDAVLPNYNTLAPTNDEIAIARELWGKVKKLASCRSRSQ